MSKRLPVVKILIFLFLVLLQSHFAFAEARTKEEIEYFLEGVGSFLINIVGPGVLVIGITFAGISMAIGNEDGMRKGAIAAGGGALIMLSRAVLDLLKDVTGF